MDSLRGIPVEYKLDAFNMPRSGTTLCHPKNWLCQSERNSALDPHGDNAYSPPHTRHETHGDIQSSIPTTTTCLSSKMQKNTIPHVRQHTLPSQHLITPFRLNTNKLKLHESCSTSKANHIPCCNKNLFIKTPFDLRHITSSSSTFQFPTNLARGLTTLSEETTQRKHTYVTTIPRLPTTKTPATKWFPLAKQ